MIKYLEDTIMKRYFTKKFTQRNIAMFEKATGKAEADLTDINLSAVDIAEVIRLGNGYKGKEFIMTEDEAYDMIEAFMDVDNNGIVDVYLQVLGELDDDIKIFKMAGETIDSIREQMYQMANDKKEKIKANTDNIVEFENKKNDEVTLVEPVVETPKEEVKVGVDGSMTLDNDIV